MRSFSLLFALAAATSVFSHPVHHEPRDRELHIIGREQEAKIVVAGETPSSELELLVAGNKAFRDGIASTDSGLLEKLTVEGQAPPFMFLGCSDSRVSEGTVFNAKPGTLFTQRNIANQFHSTDPNAHSVLSYAVAELGVNHVIVMGHYGCGGVAAAIATAPSAQVDAANGAVQNWIEPIREIFLTSTRPEIVELREKNKALAVVEEPDVKEPGFRALVEENVKSSVRRIAADSVLANHYALLAAAGENPTANSTATPIRRSGEGGAPTDVFIHGWVYDIETGEVKDLGISVGPPGKAIPPPPFAAVAKSATESTMTPHEPPKARCEQLCKAKRSLSGMLPMW
ncbi:carbonic anhydrase [Crassisporium funariophilum]|nr:carbonic anhydrase [Crassisporium funariophilum]